MNVNYLRETEKTLSALKKSGERPTLLLHSCCAPCSTAVIELLRECFTLTVFFYNPNIYPQTEYEKRFAEQRRLLELWNIPMIDGGYDIREFYSRIGGHEQDGESGARCKICCSMRLERTAAVAAEKGFEWFTTTLSVSPLKNAAALNETGLALSEKYGVKYLVSDFKKRDGYLKSVRLSGELGLYRQNYCGCEFSRKKTVE